MGENKLAFTVVGIETHNEPQDAQSALPDSPPNSPS